MLRKIILGLALLLSASPFCFGQGSSIGQGFPISSALNTPGVISTVDNALIAICSHPANAVPCTNKVTTFTDITLAHTCPTSQQLVLAGTNSCTANTDFYGNWGAWIGPGTYDFTVQLATGQAYGPFTITIPVGTNILGLNNTWTGINNFANGSLAINGVPVAAFSGAWTIGHCPLVSATTPQLTFTDGGSSCSGGGGSGTVVSSPQFQLFTQPNSGSSATAQGSNITTDATLNNLFVPGTLSVTGNFITPLNLTNNGASGNAAIKNFASDGICYASTNGSDSNDGRSWGSAKLTIRGCRISLPGGSTSPDTTGQGTIYFTDGTSANTTAANCGDWIMGPTDPNYSSPPSCWIRNPGSAIAVNLVGIAKGNYGTGPTAPKARLAGGGNADINHPCIWISGVDTQMRYENIQCNFQGRPIVVGEDSNHGRTGATVGGSSGITFVNVGASPNTVAGQGPAWDIVGGSFWLNFYFCFGQGTDSVNTITNNNAAAFLFDGTGNNGIGEIYLDHISVTSGGIKVNPGTVNPSVQMFEADHIEGESLHAPALVWITGNMGAVGLHDIVVNDTKGNGSPCNGGICAIRYDGTVPDNLTVSGAILSDSAVPSILGPMIEVGGVFGLVGQPTVTASFLRQGLRSVIGSHLIGTSDVSRRQFGITSPVYQNTALSPASYIVIPGTTLTQNVADPSGGTNATRLTATGPGEGVYVASQSGITVNVGDWFDLGAWVRSATLNGYATSGNPISIGITGCVISFNTYNFSGTTPSPSYGGDGEWEWMIAAVQVSAVSGTCQPNINVSADATHTIDLYAPVYFHVPVANAKSANEMLEIANNLQPYSNGCAIGQLCTATSAGLGNITVSSLTDTGIATGSAFIPCVSATGVLQNSGCSSGSGTVTVTNAGGNFTQFEPLVAGNATTGAASVPSSLDSGLQVGATADVKVNACNTASISAGIQRCDDSDLAGNQTLAAPMIIGDGTNAITHIFPSFGTWLTSNTFNGVSGSTTCAINQNTLTEIYAPAAPLRMQIKNGTATNGIKSLYCQSAGSYYVVDGLTFYNPSVTTASGLGFNITQGADGSRFSNLGIIDYADVHALSISGLCCGAMLFSDVINSNYTGQNPVDIEGGNGFNLFSVSMGHPAATFPIWKLNGGANSFLSAYGIYGELNNADTVTAAAQLTGQGGLNVFGIQWKAETASSTAAAFTVSNAFNSALNVFGLWMSPGGGMFTYPATAVINNFTGHTALTDAHGFLGAYVAAPAYFENETAWNFTLGGLSGGPFCLQETNGVVTNTGLACGSGGGGSSPGGLTFATQYNAGGGVLGGINSPVTNGTYQFCTVVTTSAATIPAWCLPGVVVDSQSVASYTVVAGDRAELLQTSNNTTSTAISVPQAGSAGFTANYTFVHCNTGTVIATDTPVTSKINNNSAAVLVGQVAGNNPECMFWWSDNTNYWGAEILPTDTNGRLQAAGMGALTGDVNGVAGTYGTTVKGINGTLFAGTTNDVVAFGASNTPLDSGILYTNLTTQTSNGAANNICTYTGTNKICVPGQITAAMFATGNATITINTIPCTLNGSCTITAALAFPATVSGTTTSGGIPYFSNATTLTSSGLLATQALVVGGGAGGTPTTGNGDFTYVTHTLTSGASGLVDFSAITSTAGFKVPVAAANTATAAGVIDFDSTNKNYHGFVNGADSLFANFSAAPTNNCVTKGIVASGNTLLGCSSMIDNGTTIATSETITLNGATSGSAVLSVTATGGTLDLGSSNASVTSAGVLSLGASPPACAGGAGPGCFTEGTAPSAAASQDNLHADSTQHALELNNNNTGEMPISRITCVNVSPVTDNANVTTDQNLMTCTFPANLLNVTGRTIHIHAAGIYSTAATSTAAMTVKAKLCTVSGCGSGTVISLVNIVSAALGSVTVTNNNWDLDFYSTTQTAGATAAFEAHGQFLIDLGALTSTADSVYADTNSTTVSSIDTTAQLFLQITYAYSAASTSNSVSQRQGLVEVLN